ncbi:uroporphyrinogen decarboxylase family protein [Desulfosarcina ovata]|uniref:Uroporphyrinogen III decarboxylase n=1 Tax=Desulfosarcina ovata subsp. ovata TaxID=2752305 RepID=A0A5K8A473_9BACT|nr:uroporphyrinogen decarboxylase family protein [Desulfosarcina ovata]BBO87247.1 uroporphyrinogen III decarboxylase [Desulfosarcina ovata subsp. ovata]
MDAAQRVMQVIRRRPGARIPTGELTMERAFMESLLAWNGDFPAPATLSETRLIIECARLLSHDVICLQSQPPGGGDGDPAARAGEIARVADENFFVFWIVNGAFQQVMYSSDFVTFMTAIAVSPDAIAGEMAAVSKQVIATIELGARHGAHGIILADDIAYQKSTYMSPAFGKRYLLPLWKQQVAAAKAVGLPVFFHSDGNLNHFLPFIVAAGFDGLQCIESSAGMDIFKIGQTYGDRLCLMGNIDSVLLCPAVEPAVPNGGILGLDRAVNDLTAAFGRSGGLILGTSGGLHSGMSPDLVMRMAALVPKV